MAKVQNTFLKSKMNKDLDARIVPNGEYRDALNVQVSKSEGSEVGNVENILGNASIQSFQTTTGISNLKCIGQLPDEVNSVVYLFFTDNPDENYTPTGVKSNHFIISYNVLSTASIILVKGAFLNFSQLNPLYGINILENLLFFTDNRNQPRVINVELANSQDNPLANPIYYTTEDQISVAKYNPYQCMELFQKSILATITDPVPYETTMKDVSSKFLPNGGSGLKTGPYTSALTITLNAGSFSGDLVTGSPYSVGATVGYILNNGGNIIMLNTAVTTASYGTTTSDAWDVTIAGVDQFPSITGGTTYEIIFNPNPYYNSKFSGDPDYLEDKFTRFSYRFKFVDNEYSIFAPFTQSAFIPKQDGYFMYVGDEGKTKVEDQANTYRSTVVSFVENKVNEIKLIIPLPFANYTLRNGLKISEVDILYKESDALAVKVVETIPMSTIEQSAAICAVDGAQAGPIAAGSDINIKNIRGGILVGSTITGPGIADGTVVDSFVPTNASNPVAGIITISTSAVDGLTGDVILTVADPNYYIYTYNSTKPTKTLPESDLVRVYDKVPIRSLAQEISGNRVIYANFQNKLTPPASLDYNVACTEKAEFEINEITALYQAAGTTIPAGGSFQIDVPKVPTDGGLYAGLVITCTAFGAIIPDGTLLQSTSSNTAGNNINITLTNTITLPAGPNVLLVFEPGGDVTNSTSRIEYPSSSVKTNRNYQVGFVLSDKYGRASSVILSNNTDVLTVGSSGIPYSGSTLYSPYIDESQDIDEWAGNSLKVLFNKPITTNIYNGDITSGEYNPLGWYSYKVVVKQTEQEYYNVYLPGIMASYPQDQNLEIGKTSHAVLINDNINKIPRDLNEVGPEQRQFRSSIRLFGRVENTAISIAENLGVFTNLGESNKQYYPFNNSDTVSIISTLDDLFDYSSSEPELPSYFPQFYDLNSDPLIARISTNSKMGQISTTNIGTGGANVVASVAATGTPSPPSSTVEITSVSEPAGGLLLNEFLVSGVGIPSETYVGSYTAGSPSTIGLVNSVGVNVEVQLAEKTQLIFTKTYGTPDFEIANPGLQYLAVYETEPVESLLDIFWETSTSGLISDLNTAVLNSQDTPGAIDIGGWNDDSFLESLPNTTGNHNILTGNFVLENDFGITITLDLARVIDGVLTPDYLYLTSVTNGLGENVSNQFNSAGGKDYFRLVDTSPGQTGEGPWNIRTTTIADTPISSDNYYDNIYYFPNENGQTFNREREFVFLFTARIDGLVAQLPLQFANLSNVFPIVQKVIDEVNTITYTPPPAINDVDITANRTDNTLATIFATNGADNPNLFNGLINGEVSNNLSFSIQNQIFSSGPSVGEPAVLEDSNIFSLTEAEVDAGNGFLKCQLKNDAFESPYLSSAEYQVVVAIQDGQGGGITTQTFLIDMRLIVEQDQVHNTAVRGRAVIPTIFPDNPDFNGTSTARDWTSFTYTQFDLDATTVGIAPAEVGWYIYADGFFRMEAPINLPPETGSMGSRPLLSLNGADENVPVVIPFTEAKKAILFGDDTGESFTNYRYIAPEATVEITNIAPQPNGEVIVTYDPATLTGVISTYQSAWGISDADRSGPGAAFPGAGAVILDLNSVLIFGVRYVLANDTSNNQLTLTSINSQASIGDTLYLYQGFKNENSFPWYFVPYTAGLAGVQQTFAASPYTSWRFTEIELDKQPNPATPQSGPGNFSEPANGAIYNPIHFGLFTGVDSSPDISGIEFDIV